MRSNLEPAMVDPLSLLEVVRQQHLILTLWRSISCNLGPLLHPLLLQERSGKSQSLCRLPYRTPLVRLKTRLKRSFVGRGNSGNQQQKKRDLREGVSEKTKDGALLVQDLFTRKQPDRGTPIDSPTYGMPAATDIQQPAGTDPRDESDNVHATCYA